MRFTICDLLFLDWRCRFGIQTWKRAAAPFSVEAGSGCKKDSNYLFVGLSFLVLREFPKLSGYFEEYFWAVFNDSSIYQSHTISPFCWSWYGLGIVLVWKEWWSLQKYDMWFSIYPPLRISTIEYLKSHISFSKFLGLRDPPLAPLPIPAKRSRNKEGKLIKLNRG